MQTAITILSWVLTNAPDPTTTEPPPPPTFVDVEHTDDSTMSSHTMLMVSSRPRLSNGGAAQTCASTPIFPDGVYLSATVRGENDVTIESNDPAAVSERIADVEDLLGNAPTGASKWMCALEVLATTV